MSVSVNIETANLMFDIECHHCGLTVTSESAELPPGWSFSGERDYCPDCVEDSRLCNSCWELIQIGEAFVEGKDGKITCSKCDAKCGGQSCD